jgi:hypothetical protein
VNVELSVGQVWRTEGMFGWERVERVVLPGWPDFDGGMPGIVVRERSPRGRWTQQTWFIPARSEEDAIRHLTVGGYRRFPAVKAPPSGAEGSAGE